MNVQSSHRRSPITPVFPTDVDNDIVNRLKELAQKILRSDWKSTSGARNVESFNALFIEATKDAAISSHIEFWNKVLRCLAPEQFGSEEDFFIADAESVFLIQVFLDTGNYLDAGKRVLVFNKNFPHAAEQFRKLCNAIVNARTQT